MRVFVTGINGQLGHDVVLELLRRGYEIIGSGSGTSYLGSDAVAALPYVQLNITDDKAVTETLRRLRPDAVVHCSAWTAVDAAEDKENRKKVWALNVVGPGNIARVCAQTGAKMVYLSTDYVFSGQGISPWKPDDRDFSPLNYYGQTKLEGEKAVSTVVEKYFIVRISWMFGKNGKNFVNTMLSIGKSHNTVRVVNDQIGTPTYTVDLARLLVDMIGTEKYGFYHATNEGGYISWYDFTKEIYRQAGIKTDVIPVTTEEYGASKAKRPLNSRLDKSKLRDAGFQLLPTWQNAVMRYLSESEEERIEDKAGEGLH